MDGTFPALPRQGAEVVLQRVVTDCPLDRRALYWRDDRTDLGQVSSVTCQDGGSLAVAAGGVLRFDTYFNAFFEAPWHRHTTVRDVILQVTLAGTARLLVHRHALGQKTLIEERTIGPGTVRLPIARPTTNFRQSGMITAELSAADGPFTFLSAAWLTDTPVVVETRLAAVFCTFNREADLGRVLHSLGSERAVLDRIARVVVVNQGRPGLLHTPEMADPADLIGDQLTIIEQANFGGAGGFSRGLLAALADPEITHAVLLDDDIALEPDSLLRMAAFFAFCERDVVLGGHMLDLVYPTRLYEAGAVMSDRYWNFLPQHFGRDIADADELEPLGHPYAVHYNGWWCCGIPLDLIRAQGMPLPCFIRGDDMEFGLRLHERGVPTVPMPGIAVWHEPFYLKLGNWQLYYETRNTLVAAALHQPFERWAVVRRMGRQIVTHLLTYRYYSTALILQGIEDFLAGPSVMDGPPLPRHESLGALRALHPTASTQRERVQAELQVRSIPIGRLRNFILLAWLLLRNAVLPSCTTPARLIPIEKMHWITVRNAGHFATETWWDDQLPTYRRSREQHRLLLRRSARLVLRLLRETPRAVAAWQSAAPRLTSVASWHRYLGVPQPSTPVTSRTVGSAHPPPVTTGA